MSEHPEPADELGFRCEPVPGDERWVLAVHGELDAASADQLQHEVHLAVAAHPTELRLDLEGLTFVDSMGLRALVESHRASDAAAVELTLANVPPMCRRVLEITRLTDVLHIVS